MSAEVRLDPGQLRAVETRRNAVVSAGAGSGKTTVLARRFVELVKSGEGRVDSILTLTFTRKAAAEMYERIYKLLTEERDHPLVRDQLLRFDGADISTLDSFCSRIVRGGCQAFGVSNDFTTDQEEAAAEADAFALEFLLRRRGNDFLREMYYRFGFRRVWKDLFASMAENYLSICENRDFREMAAIQIRELRARADSLAGEIESQRRAILALVDSPSSPKKTLASAAAAAGTLAPLAGQVAVGQYAEALATLALFNPRKPGGNVTDSTLVELREILAGMKDKGGLLPEAVQVLQSLSLSGDFVSMAELAAEFQEEFLSHRRSSGILAFQDVMGMAVRLLADVPEIRAHYKGRYTHIMIDEFQDNNHMQKDLLYLLAERGDRLSPGVPDAADLEPGKLFFVGDEKQSIYRFRDADVRVFKRLRSELEAYGGKFIPLDTNYRSAPGLIRFFNAFFQAVMAGSSQEYEAEFQPIGSREPAKEEGPHEPRVVLLYKPFPAGNSKESESDSGQGGPGRPDEDAGQGEAPGAAEALDSKDAEAYALAQFIRERVDRGDLPVDGGLRPAEYGDFAVLMRSLSNQVRYEKMFRLFEIPYTTMSVRTLFLEAPLNDFYNLLQLLVYPEDKVAYAGLLRSPLVNLDDRAVVDILLAGRMPFAAATLPEVLTGESKSLLPPGEEGKYRAGREMFTDLAELADSVPLSELFRRIWYEYGYRYYLMRDPSNLGYLEFYDYFQGLAQRADARGESLATFLDFLRENLGKYERIADLEILKRDRPGVQLLTIHKSKGLEFPVVVVADTGNAGAGARAGLYYVDEEVGCTVNVADEGGGRKSGINYYYEQAKLREAAMEEAELKRLLYVAMTRAKEHLILSGCHNSRNRRYDSKGARKSPDDVLLNLILDGLGIYGVDDGTEPVPSQVVVGGTEVRIHEITGITDSDVHPRSKGGCPYTLPEITRIYQEAPGVDYRFARILYTPSEINTLYLAGIHGRTGDAGAAGGREGEIRLPPGVPLPSLPSDDLLRGREIEDAFGTACHGLIEGRLQGLPPEQLQRQALSLFDEAGLSPEEAGNVLKDAEGLVNGFFGSRFWVDLAGPAWPAGDGGRGVEIEVETSFLLDAGDFLVTGRMDLLVHSESKAVVVDFKTDRAFRDGEYEAQMTLYAEAAADLTGLPVECHLFYLRSGRALRAKAGCDYRALVRGGESVGHGESGYPDR